MNKYGSSRIEASVNAHLDRTFPEADTPVIVAGVSGGADSMSLLHLLHMLGAEVHVVHINYHKRGEASRKDAALVQHVAQTKATSCRVLDAEPAQAAGKNFQQWARRLRYAAFESRAKETGAQAVATAHHEDDQIETILQKMFRGSGLASWQGMQVWSPPLFRPLLGTTRAEIEHYCQENDIAYRTDRSNLASNYARNFLRNDWLPLMEGHFPGWRENVLRVSNQAGLFESVVQSLLEQVREGRNRIRRRSFLELEAGVQRALVLQLIDELDHGRHLSRDALGELDALREIQTGASLQLASTVEIIRDRACFVLNLKEKSHEVHVPIEKEKVAAGPLSVHGITMRAEPYENPNFERALYLAFESLEWPLVLRTWSAGDGFRPFGMEGHQSVADHLTNRKVSAAEKHTALVLESFDEIIYAVIFPINEKRTPPGTISERGRCTSSTTRCLSIQI